VRRDSGVMKKKGGEGKLIRNTACKKGYRDHGDKDQYTCQSVDLTRTTVKVLQRKDGIELQPLNRTQGRRAALYKRGS